jgi:Amt family ammonium transporter
MVKRRTHWILLTLLAVAALPSVGLAADAEATIPDQAVEAAMTQMGTTADEQAALQADKDANYASLAYKDEGWVAEEEVSVSVGGESYTVTLLRKLTDTEITRYYGDILWTAIAAFLVFFMQAGFALVEAGFTRAKSAVNIIMKNVMDFSIGIIAFFVIGFHLMFAGGESLFLLGGTESSDWGMTFFIFQAVFCATAATIVSGAMAERTKFTSYLVYSAIISGIIYPISGSWMWGGLLDGGGWLEAGDQSWLASMGLPAFSDFAGSTVVHSVGGWLALAGAIVLGPRIGKYVNGKPKAIMGHNIPLAALGVFILFFGWFGFNPGSTTTFNGDLGGIAVTTGLAAAAGAVGAMLTAWGVFRKPDASMTLNGVLAGLVSITAPCATVTPFWAVVIGLVGGVIVVFSVIGLDKLCKVDDPVGAVSVHGVCGAWGTLACGLFNTPSDGVGGILVGGGPGQLVTQVIGIATAFAWAFGTGLVLFLAIKYTVGLRVSEDEELRGLDVGEHGMEAYSGFQVFTTT